MFKLIGFLVIATSMLSISCASTETSSNNRAIASTAKNFVVHTVEGIDNNPVDVYLNTEYRGNYSSQVNESIDEICKGTISLWFFKDSKGNLKYYAKTKNVIIANRRCGFAEKSASGMINCAGDDFDPNSFDASDMSYLREINFKEKFVNAPVCSSVKEVEKYKDSLKLNKFEPNGRDGELTFQVALLTVFKVNYNVRPILH